MKQAMFRLGAVQFLSIILILIGIGCAATQAGNGRIAGAFVFVFAAGLLAGTMIATQLIHGGAVADKAANPPRQDGNS